jgi:hypothetical protein
MGFSAEPPKRATTRPSNPSNHATKLAETESAPDDRLSCEESESVSFGKESQEPQERVGTATRVLLSCQPKIFHNPPFWAAAHQSAGQSAQRTASTNNAREMAGKAMPCGHQPEDLFRAVHQSAARFLGLASDRSDIPTLRSGQLRSG